MSEKDFQPSVFQQESDRLKASDANKVVRKFEKHHGTLKSKLFKDLFFVIQEDSFEVHRQKMESVIAKIKQDVILNSGQVIIERTEDKKQHSAQYLICEDGGYPGYEWGTQFDQLNRKIIHPRWITACLSQKQNSFQNSSSLPEHSSSLLFMPFPSSVPRDSFKQVYLYAIRLESVSKKDIREFNEMAFLYGCHLYK